MKNQTISEFSVLRDSNEPVRVIASEAKQSQSAIPGASANPDCFAPLAMTHVWVRVETQESLQPRDRVAMRPLGPKKPGFD
jgi:hypothetical protein